jgi:hypothetical protein
LPENIAFVAVVSGASALAPAPTAPQPTIKTNRPALARRATSDLRMLVITFNCRRWTPDAHKRSTQARRRTSIRRWSAWASGLLATTTVPTLPGAVTAWTALMIWSIGHA